MFRSLKKKVSGALHQPRERDPLSSPSRWSFSTSSFGNTTSKSSNDEGIRSSIRVLHVYDEEAPPAPAITTTIQVPLQVEPPQPSPVGETLPPKIETEAAVTHTETPPDSSGPRYVPYVDTVPTNTMFTSPSTSNAGTASYYGRVNPAIMGGFGDDEEPPRSYEDSIVLNDDEETDEEAEVQALTLRSDNEDEVPGPAEPAPAQDLARPAFHYRAISDDIMADFDFALPTLSYDTHPETLSTAPNVTPPPTESTSAAPRRGYLPISASILDDSEFDTSPLLANGKGVAPATATTSAATTSPIPVRPETSRPTSSTSTSNNPYVALFEQKDQAMALAFLRSQETLGSRSNGGDLAADDFSFGQRYQKSADTADVVLTRQRLTAEDLSGSRECPICAETKEVAMFPLFSVTPTCAHSPATCLDCLQMSIQSDLSSKLWTEIRCPECRELLDYVDIQKYADKQTFARYEALALRAAMSEASNFIWCTSGCGSGQIHDTGSDQPIVNCLHCGHRSCFVHNVAWHENLACQEYDQLIADPENFRSRIEIENDEWETLRRVQEDADRAMAQGLEAEQQAEIARREAREREERERAKKAADLARKIASRRKREEEQSTAKVAETTKPCPGCGWAIEKNEGCSHMTCIKCRYEFCWGCYNIWKNGHSISCTGGNLPARR